VIVTTFGSTAEDVVSGTDFEIPRTSVVDVEVIVVLIDRLSIPEPDIVVEKAPLSRTRVAGWIES
jgi:hypothetical protein